MPATGAEPGAGEKMGEPSGLTPVTTSLCPWAGEMMDRMTGVWADPQGAISKRAPANTVHLNKAMGIDLGRIVSSC
jgi:hypothetical protein